MTRLFRCLQLSVVLLAFSAAAAGLVSSVQIITTNSSTSTPVVLSSTHQYASKITVIGNKAARTANTGDVYIGPTATDGAQPIKITSGSEVTISTASGEWIDLNEWYVDVTTANDGVVIIYTQ